MPLYGPSTTSTSSDLLITNTTASTAYTLGASDVGFRLKTTAATAVLITVPKSATFAFTAGVSFPIVQGGSGTVQVAGEDGTVTINVPNGCTAFTRDVNSAIYLLYEGSDVWSLSGDLSGSIAGGSSGQVQYNNNGQFAGATGLTYNSATNATGLVGTNPRLNIDNSTVDPTLSITRATLYSKNDFGTGFLYQGSFGYYPAPIASALGFKSNSAWLGGNATISTMGGVAPTTSGTLAAATPAITNARTMSRLTTVTSAATAGTVVFLRSTTMSFVRTVGSLGGFRAVFRFGLVTMQTNNRGFFGLCDSTAAPTNVDPTTSTTGGKIGVGFNLNTGNWKLINNVSGTAPTVLDLGIALNTTSIFELVLTGSPGLGTIGYAFRGLTGAYVDGTLTTNIPAPSTLLERYIWMTNNTTAAAVAFGLGAAVVEADI